MTADDVVTLLRAKCGENAKAWASANGVSPSYVSDILSGRREPSPAILKPLGLKRVLSYEPVRGRK